MYVNPLAIYREYVQNAADSIESARMHERLTNDMGSIQVHVDAAARVIRIRDDGTGVSAADFQRRLTTIGASGKRGTGSRGFRGVGRLAGLGYCQTLTFRARVASDAHVHEMRWDCRKLKALLQSADYKGHLAELLREVVTVREVDGSGFPPRFFEVELESIIRHRSDVLLDVTGVAAYLAEVAPVAFAPTFQFAPAIISALQARTPVAQVQVFVNGARVYRPHRDELPSRGGAADAFDGLETIELAGSGESLAAVGWVLHHGYRGALPSSSGVGGIRLRCGNMQIGEGNLLDFVFPEQRFNAWAVGEFHVLDPRILPNGRRDHFETNAAFHDLLNQLTPIARAISTKCRTNSLLRKWERDFEQAHASAARHTAILRQNVAPQQLLEESRDALTAAIEAMEKVSERELVPDVVRRKMNRRLSAVRRHVTRSYAYPDVLKRLPLTDRRGYAECLELIYECSPDASEARTLVEGILRKLARRRR
jgi:molecular chaperone HtpG